MVTLQYAFLCPFLGQQIWFIPTNYHKMGINQWTNFHASHECGICKWCLYIRDKMLRIFCIINYNQLFIQLINFYKIYGPKSTN
jgi:hypothetical protein